jgi:hypothetical protein
VPLADEIGRKKLIKLYGRDLPLGETLVAEAVQRTKGESSTSSCWAVRTKWSMDDGRA